MSDPIHTAALEVLLGVSKKNLTSGETYSVQISRESLNRLRDAVEATFPGVLASARGHMAEHARKQASHE